MDGQVGRGGWLCCLDVISSGVAVTGCTVDLKSLNLVL